MAAQKNPRRATNLTQRSAPGMKDHVVDIDAYLSSQVVGYRLERRAAVKILSVMWAHLQDAPLLVPLLPSAASG
jgi:hypothetical protein